MSPYPKRIKCYGNITGFTTSIGEAMHIIWIKNFFQQTNIRKEYEKQILDYNVKKFSLMVRDDIDLFSSTKILTQVDKNSTLQVNSMNGAKKIREELRWYIEKNKRLRLRHS